MREGIIAIETLRTPENPDQLLMSTAICTDVVTDGTAMTAGAVVGVVIVHDLRLPKLLSKNTGWNVRSITRVSMSWTCHRARSRVSSLTNMKALDNLGH